ncbi:MAG TPA: amidase family protein, partial [Vicinamibacterales bacterium]|nr:amidase family protein [Vicinamibacterales bacterium]
MTISDCGLRIADQLLIAGCLIALTACNQPPSPASPGSPGSPVAAIDVVELSAADARDRMASGQLTSEALTKAYLDRIAKIDDAGPKLDAVIEINPNAASDAAALDAERKAGKVRGPMHGIPVLIKDNVDIAGMVNSAGSLALA